MKYLFLGGTRHGQLEDVPDGQEMVHHFEQPQTRSEGGIPILGAGGLEQETYRRRELGAQTGDGATYKRVLYVEVSVPPDMALQLLANVLIGNYLQGRLDFVAHRIEHRMGGDVDAGSSALVPGGE